MSAVAEPPAPIAPAVSSPAPAAPPTPSPAATPAPAPASAPAANPGKSGDAFDAQFSDLEGASAPVTAPAAAAEPPKPGSPAPAAPEKPAAAPVAPKPDDKPTDFDAPASATLIDTRNWGKRMGKMAKDATTRAKELEARVQELESGTQTPPDYQKIKADYDRLQAENKQFSQRIMELDYAHHPEYKEKYEKPYEDAYKEGIATASSLNVRETNADGEQTVRRGTPADFHRLYNMTDSDADEAADAMFGKSAGRVIALRDDAKRKAKTAVLALDENRTRGGELRKQRETQTEAQQAQERLALTGLFARVNTDLRTKHKDFFEERDGDAEWNADLAKGRAIAEQRFSAAYQKLAPQQRVVLDAQIMNRAAAFTPLRGLVTRLKAKLAEAESTVTALRGGGPGKPDAGATAPAATGRKTLDQEFDEKVK